MKLSEYKMDRGKLTRLFAMLRADTAPLWGRMNSQQMVEHLIDEVKWTNGKTIRTCEKSNEVRETTKQLMIYSDILLPRNYRTGDLPEFYAYPSLQASIDQLFIELDDFDKYFAIPGRTAMHPLFGALSYYEWLIWQNKHFSHHLTQFGLLSSSSRWALSEKCPYTEHELVGTN